VPAACFAAEEPKPNPVEEEEEEEEVRAEEAESDTVEGGGLPRKREVRRPRSTLG
jgi:hypothetical protein